MADQHQWFSRSRNYQRELKEHSLERHSTRTHPLAGLTKASGSSANSTATNGVITNGRPSKPVSSATKSSQQSNSSGNAVAKSSGFIDPLSMMAETADVQPHVAETRSSKAVVPRTKEQIIGPWGVKKESILARFTTTEKLTLISSYLSGDEKVVTVTKSNFVADRIQVGFYYIFQLVFSFVRLIDWLMEIGWFHSIGRSIDWLIDWLICFIFSVSFGAIG